MDVTEVKKIVQDTPHMSLARARTITDFVREHDTRDILELGFRHGVSTTYMAGALQDLGGGHITTIDLESARGEAANVEKFLDEAGLRDYVTVHYEPTSYTWRLMKMLEEDPTPRFDLCYLDGAHDWFVDGFAFFLVDRLLRPGGWIIFDDLDWTFASSPTLSVTDRVKAMPEDERSTPQVRKVFELLAMTHPQYGDFRTDDDWAYAHKLSDPSAGNGPREVVREIEVRREHYGLGAFALDASRKLRRKLGR